VVKNTIYAALGIDWPKDKLKVWILDDGNREAFRQFAKVGVSTSPVHPRTRESREHQQRAEVCQRGVCLDL
jgi:cellulose synthase/poly-beta-1,6-N-acetylglucosamine synthase-like glycosyltransferase